MNIETKLLIGSVLFLGIAAGLIFFLKPLVAKYEENDDTEMFYGFLLAALVITWLCFFIAGFVFLASLLGGCMPSGDPLPQ